MTDLDKDVDNSPLQYPATQDDSHVTKQYDPKNLHTPEDIAASITLQGDQARKELIEQEQARAQRKADQALQRKFLAADAPELLPAEVKGRLEKPLNDPTPFMAHEEAQLENPLVNESGERLFDGDSPEWDDLNRLKASATKVRGRDPSRPPRAGTKRRRHGSPSRCGSGRWG